jgi:hypothetical protein
VSSRNSPTLRVENVGAWQSSMNWILRVSSGSELRLFAGPDDVMVNQSSPKLIDHYRGFVLPIKMMLKEPRSGEGNQSKGVHGVPYGTALLTPPPCDVLDSSIHIGA